VEDKCLIGSGSTVLEEAIIKSGALVAAQSLVPPKKIVPARSLAMGVPVKIRENSVEENIFEDGVEHYLHLCDLYKRSMKRID